MNSSFKPGLALLCSSLLLTACVTINSDEPVLSAGLQSYFNDAAFPAPAEGFTLESPPDFLALPENYLLQLDRRVTHIEDEHERFRALRRWVYSIFDDFEYTTLETLSLSDLNTARKYNCLTFASLFVAAARHVDVPADFQLVFAPPYWDRSNNSWINNQHINVFGTVSLPDTVTVDSPPSFETGGITNTSIRPMLDYVADINPAVVSMQSRRQRLNEQQVLSLFYSNRSMEMLLASDLGAAYLYTRAALETDPASAVAWNNLGVLYNRVERPELAMEAFLNAIANDDRAFSAMSNLASTYRLRGEVESAIALENEVAEFRIQNPYYHAALAEDDFDAGRFEEAREHLLDALERKHNEHNFYHRLAIIAMKEGDYATVLEYLNDARQYARGTERSRFAGKIAALQDLL